MAPLTTHTGSLYSKNKYDLKVLAQDLEVDDWGTKEEIQTRIKSHLDTHKDTLENNPQFSGLYGIGRGRGKRGTSTAASDNKNASPTQASPARKTDDRNASPTRRPKGFAGQGMVESTPVKDLREVSGFLKGVEDEEEEEEEESISVPILKSPSALLRSPKPSPIFVESSSPTLGSSQTLGSSLTRPAHVEPLPQITSTTLLIYIRTVLSSSFTLFVLSAFFELVYLIYSSLDVNVVLPVIWAWAIQTLLIPGVVGSLVSFTGRRGMGGFDALTAWVVRLAGVVVYPVEVVGKKERIVLAGVGVLFAFAEHVAGARG